MHWHELEKITHADPVRRGLAGFRQDGGWLDGGQLEAAAFDLARRARRVAIITGFCCAAEGRLAAETDGPPGALFLARALDALDVGVVLVGDRYTTPLLETGLRHWQLTRVGLAELPCEDRGPRGMNDGDSSLPLTSLPLTPLPLTDRWCRDFLAGPAHGLTHLISIERPGPSHTLDSLRAQPRTAPAPEQLFAAEVPELARNRCHNVHGGDIDDQTAKAERLFELVEREHPLVSTIGIGDGGNEIGMGSYAWELLRTAVDSPVAGRVACRVATQHTLLAGVSNWAAYALGLAFCKLHGASQLAAGWDVAAERELIDRLVTEAGAVDGLTGQRTATVDGLDLETYLAPLAELRKQCGI